MKPRLPVFTIRAFAVACVAVTSGYVMWMGFRLNETLSGPSWCATALGAGKASSKDGSPIRGLEACVGLLTIQLKSISTNSHILLGSIALCLSVLIVIVVAGAKFSGEAGPAGVKANVAPAGDEPFVAGPSDPTGAVELAPTVTTTTTVAPPPPQDPAP